MYGLVQCVRATLKPISLKWSRPPSPLLPFFSSIHSGSVIYRLAGGRRRKLSSPFFSFSASSAVMRGFPPFLSFFPSFSQQYLLNKWRRPITVPEPRKMNVRGTLQLKVGAVKRACEDEKKGHTAGSLAIIFIYLAVTIKLRASIISTLCVSPDFRIPVDFGGKKFSLFPRVIGMIKDRQLNSIRGRESSSESSWTCNKSQSLFIVKAKTQNCFPKRQRQEMRDGKAFAVRWASWRNRCHVSASTTETTSKKKTTKFHFRPSPQSGGGGRQAKLKVAFRSRNVWGGFAGEKNLKSAKLKKRFA